MPHATFHGLAPELPVPMISKHSPPFNLNIESLINALILDPFQVARTPPMKRTQFPMFDLALQGFVPSVAPSVGLSRPFHPANLATQRLTMPYQAEQEAILHSQPASSEEHYGFISGKEPNMFPGKHQPDIFQLETSLTPPADLSPRLPTPLNHDNVADAVSNDEPLIPQSFEDELGFPEFRGGEAYDAAPQSFEGELVFPEFPGGGAYKAAPNSFEDEPGFPEFPGGEAYEAALLPEAKAESTVLTPTDDAIPENVSLPVPSLRNSPPPVGPQVGQSTSGTKRRAESSDIADEEVARKKIKASSGAVLEPAPLDATIQPYDDQGVFVDQDVNVQDAAAPKSTPGVLHRRKKDLKSKDGRVHRDIDGKPYRLRQPGTKGYVYHAPTTNNLPSTTGPPNYAPEGPNANVQKSKGYKKCAWSIERILNYHRNGWEIPEWAFSSPEHPLESLVSAPGNTYCGGLEDTEITIEEIFKVSVLLP